jgi:hypothetical protein
MHEIRTLHEGEFMHREDIHHTAALVMKIRATRSRSRYWFNAVARATNPSTLSIAR